jgi:hypothetical protein
LNLPVIPQPGSPIATWPDKWLPLVPPTPPPPPTPLSRVAYNYSTGTSILQSLAPGQILTVAQLVIVTPFAAGSTILLGTIADPGAFLDLSDVSQLSPGTYAMGDIVEIITSDFLVLTVLTSGSAGTGVLYYGVGT